MAEMDGLEATVAIRDTEKTKGTHTLIVAMTAHAMKGDRERCLEAAMDGYASKPIRIKELQDVIDQLTQSAQSTHIAGTTPDFETDVIDEAMLLAGIDGNKQLLRELVRLFLADYPQHLADIKGAINRGDAGAVARAEHALKGSAGNFSAQNAFAAAQSRSASSDSSIRNACWAELRSPLLPMLSM